MDSKELREKFIKFFENKGHKLVPPASLIPENDPSVLFTTAGMQQFKKFYTNPEDAPAKNVVTIQPCVRVDDIFEVGDKTHLTYFEMLGNFSFGGYFKKETIEWGYEFLTKELEINPTRIMCSVFSGDDLNSRDDESAKILESMNLKYEEHNREDNFWGPTGNEGPCGPTVEFYIDGIEVWNLVFNEYYKGADSLYRKLETSGIDTGMGFERMLVILNDLNDLYMTDLFLSLIQKIEKISKLQYGDKDDDEYIKDGKQCWVGVRKSFRIIADHYRSIIALIKENIEPGKTGRNSVLRILLRVVFVEFHKLFEVNAEKLEFSGKFEDVEKLLRQKRFRMDLKPRILELFNECDENVKKAVQLEMEEYYKLLNPGLTYLKKYFEKDEITGDIVYEGRHTFGLDIAGVKELWLFFEKKLSSNLDQELKEAEKKHQEISRAGVSGFKGGLVGESEITTRMHTATHLLLKALQEVLGKDVHQRGSNINEERIRFDFSWPDKMTDEQIKEVENIVNQKITENLPVEKKETTVEEAKELGAEAQFLAKYGQHDIITMYSIGEYSNELCGGPHVKSTAEIGKFKIVKEESSSSGVRRIRAVLE